MNMSFEQLRVVDMSQQIQLTDLKKSLAQMDYDESSEEARKLQAAQEDAREEHQPTITCCKWGCGGGSKLSW